MNRDTAYLEYMRDAVRKVEAYTTDMDTDGFLKDGKTQSAVILQLMLIGEMAKKVSEATKASFNVPWKEITGFRDRAIHSYFDVDLGIVWDTVQQDIPALKVQLGPAET
ncbi:MAG: DUF86 domain-containing protein [bacterium]|nr:DUF86 domain-containing protein [bacterium]